MRRWGLAVGVAVVAVGTAVAVGVAALVVTRDPERPAPHPVALAAPTGPTELAVEFSGAGGQQLGADLLLPTGSSGAVPAVLIVPGAGPTDRDGPAPPGLPPDPLYADIAHSLAAHGIASLRYDARGQGQSHLAVGTTLRFDDLVGDARGGLAFLAGRTEIDHRALAVVGDGWGGLVAMAAAAQDRLVRAVALVSTPGRPVVASLADRLRAEAPNPTDGQAAAAQLASVARGLAGGSPIPPPSGLATALRPVLTRDTQAYLKTVFSLDPAAIARGVHVPTLIVRGGTDPAIGPADTQNLAAALGANADVVVAAGSGHTLEADQQTTTSPSSSSVTTPDQAMQALHQGGPATVLVRDDAALGDIAAWLRSKLARPPPTGP